MTAQERVDAFFERLMKDPNFQTFAVMLGPYRALMPAGDVVKMIEGVIEHWNQTAPEEATT